MIRAAGKERFRLFRQHQAARTGTVGAKEGVGEELIRRQQAEARTDESIGRQLAFGRSALEAMMRNLQDIRLEMV